MKTLLIIILLFFGGAVMAEQKPVSSAADATICPLPKWPKGIPKTDAEWRKALTPEQYRILREKGTEMAFSGVYQDNHSPGVYRCAACGAVLFRSEDKFNSGTGWPSFIRPAPDNNIGYREDNAYGMQRTEVYCKVCGGHLGHVFDDGPQPTGKRFCINSAALDFKPAKKIYAGTNLPG